MTQLQRQIQVTKKVSVKGVTSGGPSSVDEYPLSEQSRLTPCRCITLFKYLFTFVFVLCARGQGAWNRRPTIPSDRDLAKGDSGCSEPTSLRMRTMRESKR